jgi:hypothetical protein
MFEHHHEPLLPQHHFFRRMARHFGLAAVVLGGSLAVGILGYRYGEGLSWVDSLLNASMILSGMGPATELHTNAGKLFASACAIFSGVAFITTMAVLFAPVIHRFLHKFHRQAADR